MCIDSLAIRLGIERVCPTLFPDAALLGSMISPVQLEKSLCFVQEAGASMELWMAWILEHILVLCVSYQSTVVCKEIIPKETRDMKVQLN